MTLDKLSSKDFTLLKRKESKFFKTKHLFFFYTTAADTVVDKTVSYGITVTKKKVRNAVGRNKIKRLLREGLRSSQNCKNIEKSIKVNIVYAPKSDLSSSLCFHDLHQEVEQFFSKLT